MSHRTKNHDTPEQIGKVMHVEFDFGVTRMSGGDNTDGGEVKTDHYVSEFDETVRI